MSHWSEKDARMKPRVNTEEVERNAEIWRKKRGGMSHGQLAKLYGMSRQRICQICQREKYRVQQMHSGE